MGGKTRRCLGFTTFEIRGNAGDTGKLSPLICILLTISVPIFPPHDHLANKEFFLDDQKLYSCMSKHFSNNNLLRQPSLSNVLQDGRTLGELNYAILQYVLDRLTTIRTKRNIL